MGDKTGISWTEATWNPIRGCSRVSEGCRNCYAERVAARFSKPGQPYHGFAQVVAPRDLLDRVGGRRNGWTRKVAIVAEHLADPLRWKRPRLVFVNSMSDLFHEGLTNEQIAAVFGVMAAAPQHTFQVLTKRAARMREWFAWVDRERAGSYLPNHEAAVVVKHAEEHVGPLGATCAWPLPNVWLGVSVENQAAADERIPELLATPAAVRFLSCEPLIGEVDLHAIQIPEEREGLRFSALQRHHDDRFGSTDTTIDWVIAGCESGPGARPCSVEWLRSLRDQCAAAGVAFFLKQAKYIDGPRGTSSPIAAHPPLVYEGSHGAKWKAGGVIELPYLDGVQHAAFPKETDRG